MQVSNSFRRKPTIVDVSLERFCNFFWAPNDEYLIADYGTDIHRRGYIVFTKHAKQVDEINYTFTPIWSPDSKTIVIGKWNQIKTIIDTSLEGTVDIAIYNITTKKEEIIAKATSDFYYQPLKWSNDGMLTYTKRYFSEEQEEIKNYRLKL